MCYALDILNRRINGGEKEGGGGVGVAEGEGWP